MKPIRQEKTNEHLVPGGIARVVFLPGSNYPIVSEIAVLNSYTQSLLLLRDEFIESSQLKHCVGLYVLSQ